MANLKMNIPHCLPKDEALVKIKQMLTKVKKEQIDSISNLKENWNNYVGTFSFTAKGFEISGTLTVENKEIVLNGKIPWAASFFEGKIKKIINEEAQKLLS